MSNIRCPMCAKQNPVEADTCSFCGARLRPVSAQPAPQKDEADDLGWLRDLSSQGGKPSQPPPKEQPKDQPVDDSRIPGEDTPSWLSRIRQRSTTEPDAVSPIGRDPLSEPPPGPPADDWMASLRPLGGFEMPPENAPGAEQPQAEDTQDDWLSTFNQRLGGSDPFSPPGPVSQPKAEPTWSEPPAAEEAAPAVDMPDWLKQFGGFEALEKGLPADQRQAPPPPPPAEEPPAELADETPDWLKALSETPAGKAMSRPEEPPAQADALPAENMPDWLAGLGPGLPPVEPAPPAQAVPEVSPSGGTGMTDWLARFDARPAAPEPTPPAPAPAPAAAPPAEGMPAWLSGLDAGSPPVESAPPVEHVEEITPSGGMTGWLATFEAGSPPVEPPPPASPTPPAPPPGSGDELPDWLSGFGSAAPPAPAQPAAQSTPPAAPVPAEEKLPDWLRDMDTPAAGLRPVTPPAEEVPAWFNDLGQAGPPVPDALPASPAQEEPPSGTWLDDLETIYPSRPASVPESDLSDWLKSLETRPPTSADSRPAAKPAQPDWPAAEKAAPPSPPAQPAPAAAPGPESLDWLQSLSATPAPQAAPGEIPDWLDSFSIEGQQPSAEPPALMPEAAPAQGDGADWLSAFAASAAVPETPAQPPFESASVENEGGALPAEDLPEWLRPAAAAQPSAAAPAQPGPASVSPFSQEGLPDWMQQEGQAQPEPVPSRLVDRSAEHLNAGPAHPFAGDELPEWLSKTEGEAAPARAAASQEGLEQVQLPSWVQAMRPLESAAPNVSPQADDQRIEKSGPLAGLRGILPGEELVAAYHKPPVYTARLHVSDKQQSHAALLESLLGSEVKAQDLPAEASQAPRYFVRLLTAVALITLLLILLLVGLPPLEPVGLSSADPQVGVLSNMINKLPENTPVLVAVEYEVGLQGEMKASALPVLSHLMARKARLVLVSTNPTGPLLAERLTAEALKNQAAFIPAEKQANLGYLLGGSTALKQFASGGPLSQTVPQLWDGSSWAGNRVLAGLNRISDFKLILLITDNPETGRAWVEQVQAEVNNNPQMVIVSSAQSAPILRPYQASGQVQALISGLVGGAAYEQLRQTPGYGTSYWNAYQAGSLAIVLFILMGGIVSLLFRSTPKPNAKK